MRRCLLLTAAALFVIPAGASAQQSMTIKFSHVVAENTPKGQAALKFKQEAERILAGKVKVEVYPNSQLFGDAKEMEAVALGDVHFIATSLSKFDKFTKKLQLFDLPFLFDDMAAVDKFEASKIGQDLLHAMEAKNYVGLAYWHNGLKQISANKPLLVPADAKNLKFRIQQSDLLAAQFQALGAVPQKLAFSEVYQALQVGTVDGQENTWSNIYSQKFFEVQKHFTETNHGVVDYMVLTNGQWWKGLSPEIRDGLTKAMAAATKTNNEVAEKLNEDAKKKIVASGATTIHQLTPDQRAQWKKAMEVVWKKFEGEIGKDLVEAALKTNSKTN